MIHLKPRVLNFIRMFVWDFYKKNKSKFVNWLYISAMTFSEHCVLRSNTIKVTFI